MTALESTTVWVIVVGLSLVTYALRSSFLLGIDSIGDLPPMLERVLPFVPAAVLAALIAPNLVQTGGTTATYPEYARLLAGSVAFGVAWYTENMLATVGVGMTVLWGSLWL